MVVGILVLMVLVCQGLAFAETEQDDVTVVAEEMDAVAMDPATGTIVEEDMIVADELVAPDAEPVEEAMM
jgi:hypothetical protein